METQTQSIVSTGVKTMTVREFMEANGFTQIVKVVRVNTNQYPYLTFINANNQAENIYFSTKAGEKVTEGQDISTINLKSHVMALVKYDDGRPDQWKISTGNSLRASIEDLGL